VSPLTPVTILLRIGGTVLCLAAGAVLLPREVMISTHARLGLGTLPDVPIVYYLARSTSALYALRGVIYFLAASDPIRYRSLIILIGVTNIVFGVTMAAITTTAGMPGWWTAVEGPFIVGTGVVLLALVRGVPRQ
jgi:hypothetical protein